VVQFLFSINKKIKSKSRFCHISKIVGSHLNVQSNLAENQLMPPNGHALLEIVKKHLVCMDDAILHGKPFGIPLIHN
jgi:hypothetical protein